jgi:hypothetical protein
LAVADELGITLKWGSRDFTYGGFHNVAFSLSKKLGIVTLSVNQFMEFASQKTEVAS